MPGRPSYESRRDVSPAIAVGVGVAGLGSPLREHVEHRGVFGFLNHRLIAEVQVAGLIARRRSTTDRRALIIELSRKGTMVLARDIRARRAWLERAMRVALTPTERTLLKLSAELMLRVAASEVADERVAAS